MAIIIMNVYIHNTYSYSFRNINHKTPKKSMQFKLLNKIDKLNHTGKNYQLFHKLGFFSISETGTHTHRHTSTQQTIYFLKHIYNILFYQLIA